MTQVTHLMQTQPGFQAQNLRGLVIPGKWDKGPDRR